MFAKRSRRLLLTAGLVLPAVLYFLIAKQPIYRGLQDKVVRSTNITNARMLMNAVLETTGSENHPEQPATEKKEHVDMKLTSGVQCVVPPHGGAAALQGAEVLTDTEQVSGPECITSNQSAALSLPETKRDKKTQDLNVIPPFLKYLRKKVAEQFNADQDFTVLKSQVEVGQLIKYEVTNKEYVNITENFYRLIPEASPLLGKHFRSCAVVGNSGTLLGSNCGQQIDSVDFVIRCNLAPLEGFEKDVGLKSNLTSMNPSVIPHYFKGWDKNIPSILNRFVRRLRLLEDQILYIPAFVTKNGRDHVEFTNRMILEHKLPVKLAYAPRETNKKMKAMWRDSDFRMKRPSTGAYMFAIAVSFCDHIHMYGFYPFKTDPQGVKMRYHYYDGGSGNGIHNMTEEFRAYQALHNRKILTLHTGPCHRE